MSYSNVFESLTPPTMYVARHKRDGIPRDIFPFVVQRSFLVLFPGVFRSRSSLDQKPGPS